MATTVNPTRENTRSGYHQLSVLKQLLAGWGLRSRVGAASWERAQKMKARARGGSALPYGAAFCGASALRGASADGEGRRHVVSGNRQRGTGRENFHRLSVFFATTSQ